MGLADRAARRDTDHQGEEGRAHFCKVLALASEASATHKSPEKGIGDRRENPEFMQFKTVHCIRLHKVP